MLGNIIAGGEIIGNLAGGGRRYFLKDHLGSVRTTVDRNGNIVGRDDYYPFGLVMPGRSLNSANPNNHYKFTGYELDNEAGLTVYHANARGYDPVLGRFLQIDPMAMHYPSLTPYNYVSNDPINYVDPTGMYRVGAVGRNSKGVLARAYRQSIATVRNIEMANTALGFTPAGPFASMFKSIAFQTGHGSDPSWSTSGWDRLSMLGGGIFAAPRKLQPALSTFREQTNVLGIGVSAKNRFITPKVGRDEVVFDVATSATGNLFRYGDGFGNVNKESITLNENFANALVELGGGNLDIAGEFTNNYLGATSSIIEGLANSLGADLTTQGGRSAVLDHYNEHKDILDAFIMKLSYTKTVHENVDQ